MQIIDLPLGAVDLGRGTPSTRGAQCMGVGLRESLASGA